MAKSLVPFMKKVLIGSLLLVAVLSLTGWYAFTSGPFKKENASQKIEGVCFVAPQEKMSENPFGPLKALGANHIAVIPYAFSRQGEPAVRYDYQHQWWGETYKGAKKTIAYAREKQLKVMLKPHVWVSGKGWPGDFALSGEKAWQQWESDYKEYILQFARLAEKKNVALFCVGTEYKQAAKQRPQFWEALIQDVRKIYDGKVTYQANWDNFQNIEFWDKLDLISISGYFPLKKEQFEEESAILKAWDQHLADIKSVHQKFDKPVMFGEYGYCSMDNALAKPWEGVRKKDEPVNLTVQKQAYQALYRKFWHKDWFKGGFLWKWYKDHEKAGGKNDKAYTPQNKPAEKVIKKWY